MRAARPKTQGLTFEMEDRPLRSNAVPSAHPFAGAFGEPRRIAFESVLRACGGWHVGTTKGVPSASTATNKITRAPVPATA